MKQWIPVTERPPDANGQYLVTFYDTFFGRSRVSELTFRLKNVELGNPWGTWIFDEGSDCWLSCDTVMAWMPMPEPYKEERDETD